MTPRTVANPSIRFSGRTGYTRHADSVTLFADRIDNLDAADGSSADLALQLWACETPYDGGGLAGWKLAELPLGTLHSHDCIAPVESEVPARYPESGDFAIALVLAESDGDGFNRIQDFHNYPSRDTFVHPRLEGTLAYRCVDAERLVIEVGRIHNPRDPQNTSGTLSLELWALPAPYSGGGFQGQALAGITLGALAGGAQWQDGVYELHYTPPEAGTFTLVLMLREWTGDGYVTRDHLNFSVPVTFPLVADVAPTAEAASAAEPHGQTANPAPGPQSKAEPHYDSTAPDQPLEQNLQESAGASDAGSAGHGPIKELASLVARLLERLRRRLPR